jgi:hypothetical protein
MQYALQQLLLHNIRKNVSQQPQPLRWLEEAKKPPIYNHHCEPSLA